MAGADILIVDDDPDIRDALSQAFELEGYTVALAQHGRDALSKLRGGTSPKFILLDLMMPVMNGAEFLVELRADPELRPLPVVMVTAFGSRAAPCMEEVQGFLPKPVDLDTLLELAASYCRASAG